LSYLIDTNVLSEIRKGKRANTAVWGWWNSTEDSELFLSVMVLGEVQRGIEKLRRKDQEGAQALESWKKKVVNGFDERVLPVDRKIAEIWGAMGVERTLPAVDSLVAATAVAYNLILVTRNIKEMQGSGARLLNPFED